MQRLIDDHRAAYEAFLAAMKSDPYAKGESVTAGHAEAIAFDAICTYRCGTLEQARLRAAYPLGTATANDHWDERAKALLMSYLDRGDL